MKRQVEWYSGVAAIVVVLMFVAGCCHPGGGEGSPDLIIDSLTVTNTSAHVGETIRVIDVTKNLTNVCTGNFYDRIYLSPTTSNPVTGYWTNHQIMVGVGMGKGATKVWTGQLTIANVSAGLYYICDVADGSNTVGEISEINNTNCVPINILNP